MAGTTTNYAWTYPTSTDLVKDGATAIQTAIQGADTTLFTALGGAYPGLRLIKKQTIGSAVSSVVVSSVFSSTFESYLVRVNGTTASATVNLLFQLSAATGSTYTQSYEYYAYGSATSSISASSGTSTIVCQMDAATPYSAIIEVDGPNLARATYGTMIGNSTTYSGQGRYKETSSGQSTGFTLTPLSGTLTGGTVAVYGYGIS